MAPKEDPRAAGSRIRNNRKLDAALRCPDSTTFVPGDPTGPLWLLSVTDRAERGRSIFRGRRFRCASSSPFFKARREEAARAAKGTSCSPRPTGWGFGENENRRAK